MPAVGIVVIIKVWMNMMKEGICGPGGLLGLDAGRPGGLKALEDWRVDQNGVLCQNV